METSISDDVETEEERKGENRLRGACLTLYVSATRSVEARMDVRHANIHEWIDDVAQHENLSNCSD